MNARFSFDVRRDRSAAGSMIVLVACVLIASLAAPAHAQDDAMTSIPVPAQPDAIALGTGRLAAGEVDESWHRQYARVFARNVTVATLTPFLPEPDKASGTAVIVAPGGGFRTLSMENEGWDVARALAQRGVAAFVLKYRLHQTPADLDGFARSMQEMFSSPRPARTAPDEAGAELAPQIADAQAAFDLVRRRAADWHVNPDRIGMIGFSAGAMLTMATTLVDGDARPAFIANIYGPAQPASVPANAPPLFVALAADDGLFPDRGIGLVQAWLEARRPVEFHLYERGGHGFGMYPKETTSTGWFDDFVRWMAMHGYLEPDAAARTSAPPRD